MSGNSVAVECLQCGASLPARAKFCLECGTPVAADVDHDSRRTVTLLFTDVTGSTSMGEQLDPEAYRAVMGRYFAAARAAVERHGGRVEKFVGDAVLAVFGLPEIREDDALRAVRAAFELNAAVAGLSERLVAELGVRLLIRTGVNTGAVVTGSARAGGSFATGDAVNTAARLEQAAGAGEILLGATTYTLVRDAIEAEPVEPVQAKGKSERVPAYRLVSVLDQERGRRRHEDAPLVGRDRESRALDDTLERTLATGRSHLITVIGPAGIGKSRLLSEFLHRVGARAAVASGRCVSYGQGITYWPLVQAVRQALALSGTESEEIVRHAVEQAMGGAADAADAVEILMPLLARAGTPSDGPTTTWAVRRLLEEVAAQRPLVLTIDDLHWAEPALLELLDTVRAEVSDLPLVLVCLARPELIEQHPTWGSGSFNAQTFALDPLTVDDVESSLAALLDGRPPVDLSRVVTSWSGGNPLFVEEIVTHLTESGALHQGADGWELTGDLDRQEMPPSVSALLNSRLDRLPDDERDLVERLSVIGLEFTQEDATVLVDEADVTGLLTALVRRDLLRRVRSTSGDTWAFKHIMVRDAAYESLAKALRAELHERFADGIADNDVIGAERESFVAHHLAQSVTYHRELGERGPRIDALVERAVRALAAAAQSARDRDDTATSLDLVERALALGPAEQATRRDLIARMVQIHQANDSVDGLTRCLEALGMADDDTATPLDAALTECVRCHLAFWGTGEMSYDQAQAANTALVDLARAAGDRLRLEIGLVSLLWAFANMGLWVRAEETRAELEQVGDTHTQRLCDLAASLTLLWGPAHLEVLRARAEARAEATGLSPEHRLRLEIVATMAAAALGLDPDGRRRRDLDAAVGRPAGPPLEGPWDTWTEANRNNILILNGDLDEAITSLAATVRRLRADGNMANAATYLSWKLVLELERGDPTTGKSEELEEAMRWTGPDDLVSLTFIAAIRAILSSREGRDDALQLADEAVRTVDHSDSPLERADLRRWMAAVYRDNGREDHARQLLFEAAELYASKGMVVLEARVRDAAADL